MLTSSAYCHSIYYYSCHDSYRDPLHIEVSSHCCGDSEGAEPEEICTFSWCQSRSSALDHCKTAVAC